MNEARDRFCGGCGHGLAVVAHAPVPAAAPVLKAVPPPPPPAAVVTPSAARKTGSIELEGLFAKLQAPAAAPKLPDANISQDDIDSLFGGAP